MKILLDTNIILDVVLKRQPFFENSYRIMKLCSEKKCDGFLAAHTITNAFYIMRKHFSNAETRNAILNLLVVFKVISINIENISRALLNENFKDFEDCLQVECAIAVKADYIITRDKNDFAESEIPCVTPAEFFNLFDELEEKI